MKLSVFKKHTNYFPTLFFRITTLILGIVLFLTVFLYISFRNFGLDLINKSNQRILTQVANNASSLNQHATTYASALATHPSITDLMYSQVLSPIERLNHFGILNHSLHSTPFAHSIYTYNGRMDTYNAIGSVTTTQKGEFFDKELMDILTDYYSLGKLTPIPRRIPTTKYGDPKYADVYTYIISETFFNTDRLKNALVVNIEVDWLFHSKTSVFNHFSQNNDNIIIIDQQGNVVGHSLRDLYLQNISDQSYIEKILLHENPSGYFITDIGGEKCVVTFVSLSFPNWTFISTTPYDQVATGIAKVKLLTVLIFILVVLIGFFITYFVSKKLYSPVESLRHKVEKIAGKPFTYLEDSNEFDMILNHLHYTSDELKVLKAFKTTNLQILKKDFLKNLLFHSKTSFKDIDSDCKAYNIKLDVHMPIQLLILKIDHYIDFHTQYNAIDQALYRFALINMCNEILSESYSCECFDLDSDHIVILVSLLDNTDLFNASPYFEQYIKKTQQNFYQYFKISISGFISEVTDDIHELPVLYQDTLELSKYRIKFGHKCILTHEHLKTHALHPFDINRESFENLLYALKNENLEEANQKLTDLVNVLYHTSYNTISITLSHLSTSVFNMLALLESNSNIYFEIDFLAFNNKIQQAETLHAIQELYSSLFEKIATKIQSYKSQKSEGVIETVVHYIEMHYMDPNLYAEKLGEIVNLSPSYLNKLFNKHTSQSISSYIKEVRLLKASALLKDTNATIEEIGNQIGWENKQYFYTVFKKKFGVTPTEYRSKIIMEKHLS